MSCSAPSLQRPTTARSRDSSGNGTEHLGHALALHFMLSRIHQTLRGTPAMEAGVADHVWELEEIVDLLDRMP